MKIYFKARKYQNALENYEKYQFIKQKYEGKDNLEFAET